MPDSSTVDLSANWNMAPRGGSLPRADHRIPCISYLFLKTLASKKGQMWTEGRHSVFFPPPPLSYHLSAPQPNLPNLSATIIYMHFGEEGTRGGKFGVCASSPNSSSFFNPRRLWKAEICNSKCWPSRYEIML